MKNAAVLGLLCVALTGCLSNSGSNHINMVKGSTFSGINKSVTIGEALTERPICDTTTWEYKTNERNEPIVEYRCKLDGYQKEYTRVNKQKLNDTLAKAQEKRYRTLNAIAVLQAKTDELYKSSLQVEALENALYTIHNQQIFKDYKRVNRNLKVKTHDYRFIFDAKKEHKLNDRSTPDQIELNWLEQRIKNIFIDAGVKDSYYEELGLNLSKEGGVDLLALTEPQIVNYISRKQQNIYRRSMDVEKEITEQKVVLYSLRNVNETVEDFVPKTVEQVIQFNVSTGAPVPVYCNFNIDSIPNDQQNSSIHSSYCLKMAYDKKYNESFKQLFTENFEAKLSLKY